MFLAHLIQTAPARNVDNFELSATRRLAAFCNEPSDWLKQEEYYFRQHVGNGRSTEQVDQCGQRLAVPVVRSGRKCRPFVLLHGSFMDLYCFK